MEGYDKETYGRIWAPYYDTIYTGVDPSTIRLLAAYAGEPAQALELAIGSGRIAIPLAEAGVDVTGIDISPEMVALMRAKPGGETIRVIMGDFADIPVDGLFPLIYLGFNTLFVLDDQQRQVECFVNTAAHLQPGGCFIVQAFVPDMKRFDRHGSYVGASSISGVASHSYEISVHDAANQRVTSHTVQRDEDGTTTTLPVVLRYAWPSEMDLMARIAGLELEERWGWYDRQPFTDQSDNHVSVYRKPL